MSVYVQTPTDSVQESAGKYLSCAVNKDPDRFLGERYFSSPSDRLYSSLCSGPAGKLLIQIHGID